MKYRNLVLAVAALACGSAMAQTIPPFGGGNGGWDVIPIPQPIPALKASIDFSADGRSALIASGTQVSARILGAASDAPNNVQWPGGSSWEALFKVTDTSAVNGQVTALTSAGSSLKIRRILVGDTAEIEINKSLYLSDFSFNLVTGAITANWTLQDSLKGTVEALGSHVLFQAQGPITSGSLQTNGTGSIYATLADLHLATASSDLLFNALNIDGSGGIGDLARNATWGSATISAAVPEPSSYLLISFGLIAVGAATRRKK